MIKGERVIAARTLWRWGLGLGVPKGTHGVVQDVSSSGTMTVDFGNGQVYTARDGDVRQERAGAGRPEPPPGKPEPHPPPWLLTVHQRAEEGISAGDAIMTLSAGVMMILLAVLGLILTIDGVGYFAGYGQQRTVHIEETHTTVITFWKTEPGPDDTVESVPGTEAITIGSGYYLDSSGHRHSVRLRGDGLKAGIVVHVRQPLLASSLLPELRSAEDGAGFIVGGLLCAACAVSEFALGSSPVSRARFFVGALGILQAFLIMWMLN